MWRRPRYMLRQLVMLVAAVSVPLIALQWYGSYQSQQSTRDLAYRSVENYAASVAQDADVLLADTEQYLEFLSRRPMILGLDPARCDPLLDGVTRRRRHLANVFVVDAAGRPICYSVTGPGQAPANLSVYPWYLAARRVDKVSVSAPFKAPVVQRMVVAVSMPLHDSAGTRTGTISALLDLDSLRQSWSRYTLPARSRLLIYDDAGIVVTAHPDFESLVGKDITATLRRTRELNAGDIGITPGLDGVERAFARKPITRVGWYASAAIPTEAVFGAAERQFRQRMAVTALVVVAVLLIAILMARRMMSSLGALVQAARSVHAGAADVRAPAHLPGEFGELAHEFNAMLDAARRHADFYGALSRTNGAIVRSDTPDRLFEEICRICVEHGHASIAYISLIEGDTLRHAAWAGPAHAFVSQLTVRVADRTVQGSGLSGLAAHTGQRQVSNDVYEDPRTVPWREAGAAIGTRSIAAFPFRRLGRTAGALTLHMTHTDFFDDRVIALLEEMTEDISFALDNFARTRAFELQDRQLAGIVDTAMDAIISIDGDYRIRLFNRAAAEMFRVSGRTVLGDTLDRFIPRRFHALHKAHVANFRETGSTARRMGLHALVALRSDGQEFPIEASISKLGEGANALMTVVVRDATELIAAQEAQVARTAAESASRAKTDFLSRMSHELRTPLNAVLGFSQLLQTDDRDPLTTGQHGHVERIRLAGWHLLSLINDVLDVSRIEAGRVAIDEQQVELIGAIDEAVRMTQSAADTAGITIVPTYRDGQIATVWADARRLRQVLLNLLSNAIKYNRPQGTVEVVVRSAATATSVEVIDSGMGMDADQLQHLYEPFNRLGRERNDIEGTGLGLALAQQLIHLMRGEIAIHSEAGVGTRVRLTLRTSVDAPSPPRTAPPPPMSDVDARPDAAPAGVVIYIEDNPVNFMLVEHLLRRWPDVTLLGAETGTSGLAIARATPADLILLDMRLPDMDGIDVIRHLRADPETRSRRIVALSASAMPAEVAAAMEAGAAHYWTKPLDFDQFLREMRDLLRPLVHA